MLVKVSPVVLGTLPTGHYSFILTRQLGGRFMLLALFDTGGNVCDMGEARALGGLRWWPPDPGPELGWVGLEATGQDLLANAAKENEALAGGASFPGRKVSRQEAESGPPLRSSPRSFLGRGPPGRAAGLSTSLRHLWVRKEREAVSSPPRRKPSCRLPACFSHRHWCGRRQTLKRERSTDGKEGGMDGQVVFLATASHSVMF